MRIALIASGASPVRRVGSESIESVVWLLGRELTRLGHQVTTFACAGSDVEGELVVALPGPYARDGSPDEWRLCEWMLVCRAVAEARRFDVVHSHNYLWAMPLAGLCAAPLVHTLHVSPYADDALLWRQHPDQFVTAISRAQWGAFTDLTPAAVIPHAVDESQFDFRAVPDDYLLYFGRFTEGKGALVAINVARKLGQRLLLVGPRSAYFTHMVERHVDGDRVRYVGAATGEARARLLGGARALVYPVQSPEPFGLVLVEAMLCGTPPAAVGIGAVPEVVEDGVSGCVAASADELPTAVERAMALDRARVCASAMRRCSPARMAEQYVAVYQARVAKRGTERGAERVAERGAGGSVGVGAGAGAGARAGTLHETSGVV